jgi:hypothetical protein
MSNEDRHYICFHGGADLHLRISLLMMRMANSLNRGHHVENQALVDKVGFQSDL